MKLINYTALKKNLGQYLQAKAAEKASNPLPEASIQEIFDYFG